MILSVEVIAAAIWLFSPKFGTGPPGGAYTFRAQERMLALSDWTQHPSLATKAAWDGELAQLRNHNLITRDIPVAALLILVNGALLYALWKCRTTTQTG